MICLLIRNNIESPWMRDVFVVTNNRRELKEDRKLSDALAREQKRQKQTIDFDPNDTSIYMQRLPENPPVPEFVIEIEETGNKYVMLFTKGVFQWYFKSKSETNIFSSLPPKSPICYHGFFSQELVPVTKKTHLEMCALYEAARPELSCRWKNPHVHLRIHIYLHLDMAANGPCSGKTTYVRLSVCDDTTLANLFFGAGGQAAANNNFLLRNFSWGNTSANKQSVLVTGHPFSYYCAKEYNLTIKDCSWQRDEGLIWLYPLQSVPVEI